MNFFWGIGYDNLGTVRTAVPIYLGTMEQPQALDKIIPGRYTTLTQTNSITRKYGDVTTPLERLHRLLNDTLKAQQRQEVLRRMKQYEERV